MPRFAANLTMLFNEVDFLSRFQAAAKAGFRGVEYLFPTVTTNNNWLSYWISTSWNKYYTTFRQGTGRLVSEESLACLTVNQNFRMALAKQSAMQKRLDAVN
jgi:hydroxypyruvate isomerase